jgi:hypothetical protein
MGFTTPQHASIGQQVGGAPSEVQFPVDRVLTRELRRSRLAAATLPAATSSNPTVNSSPAPPTNARRAPRLDAG